MAEHIYWLKHAPIERRALEIIGSGTDRDLGEHGVNHARSLAHSIKFLLETGGIEAPATKLYTSPLKRAVSTAEIIAATCELDIEIMEHLTAQHFGALEGKTVTELERDPTLAQYLYGNIPLDERFSSRAPGGESQSDVFERMSAARRMLWLAQENPTVITHGSFLNTVIGSLLRLVPNDWDNQNFNYAGHVIDEQRWDMNTIELRSAHHE